MTDLSGAETTIVVQLLNRHLVGAVKSRALDDLSDVDPLMIGCCANASGLETIS